MSRIYDNWEKLVGSVLRREKDRQLALCQSFSSSSSADVSLRSSFSSHPLNEIFDPTDPSSHCVLYLRDVKALEFEVIKEATRNFHPDLLVGEGGFGLVYRGWIYERSLTAVVPQSGTAVAVKIRRHEGMEEHVEWSSCPEGFRGHTEWLNEINYLSRLHHPNLVKLSGYCINEAGRILVYEFMPGGSLDNHSFGRGNQPLSWDIRIKAAIDVARALSFLHELDIPIIHRGFNTGDILLDGEFNAKLSDFGLARDGPTGDKTYVSDEVMGTMGYAAPDYIATGRVTTKCDVYSFGVVLLELLSGLRVLDNNRPPDKKYLLFSGTSFLTHKRGQMQIVDSRLEGRYPRERVFKVAKLASRCLSQMPEYRPTMSEVVAALEQLCK